MKNNTNIQSELIQNNLNATLSDERNIAVLKRLTDK